MSFIPFTLHDPRRAVVHIVDVHTAIDELRTFILLYIPSKELLVFTELPRRNKGKTQHVYIYGIIWYLHIQLFNVTLVRVQNYKSMSRVFGIQIVR